MATDPDRPYKLHSSIWGMFLRDPSRIGGSSRMPICFTRLIYHSANCLHTATAPSTATPIIIPRDLQHMRWPGLLDCAVHPGYTSQRLQCHASNGDQYHQPGLLPQHIRIRRGVFAGYHHNYWWCIEGSDPGHQRPSPGMEHGVEALPRDGRGELQVCLKRQTELACRRIPPPLYP